LGLTLLRMGTRPQRVVSSDLRRATETARIVARVLDLPPPRPDIRLRERRAEWSGLTSTQIERRHPGLLDRWRAGRLRELPGSSEPWAAFVARVLAGIRDQGRRPGLTLVVAHAGVFQVLPGARRRRPENGEGVPLRIVGGDVRAAHARRL
jgi:broad specificity phosphatase PhoE